MEGNERTTGPACVTCREKCRRCDRTRPVCRRCVSKGLECKGYPDKFRFCGIASRGKWKNQRVPIVHNTPSEPRDRQQRKTASRQARRVATLAASSSEDEPQPPSSSHSPDTWMVEASPQEPNHVWSRPENQSGKRAVELNDLLMLDRPETLLAHCKILPGDTHL